MEGTFVRCWVFLLAASFLASASVHATPGDLYVADATLHSVYRFTPTGNKSTFASGLYQPVALAFDHSGNLFVADSGSCSSTGGGGCSQPSVIYQFTPSGLRTTFATLNSSGLLGMAFDSAGNLFVSDGGFIHKFTPDGTEVPFSSSVAGAWALAFDKSGGLYVTSNPLGSGLIVRIAPDGTQTTFTSVPGSAIGLAFDSSGNLFVIANSGSEIDRITPAGSKSVFASGSFTALAFDGQGNLFAGSLAFNSNETSIVKFTSSGVKTAFAKGPLDPSYIAIEPVVEKLRNVSARGVVGTRDDVLIAGFVLGGNALANNAVVLRAMGPSLSRYGVSHALSDPVLELHNSNGVIIASNDNWQSTQAAQIRASGLAPSDPREAAIFATLPAGNFTAVVRGAGGATGTALAEVYSVQ